MTAMQVDAGAVYNAALACLSAGEDSGGTDAASPRIRRIEALARMAEYGLRKAGTAWISLSLEDFILIETELRAEQDRRNAMDRA